MSHFGGVDHGVDEFSGGCVTVCVCVCKREKMKKGEVFGLYAMPLLHAFLKIFLKISN